MEHKKHQGMTLLEITVVLLVLIALAGLTIPYIGGTSRKALCDATDISMANIKRAIMDRYYLDTLGKFPQDLSVLSPNTPPKYNLHYLFSDRNLDGSRIHKPFDPDTATGWRSGGYLQGGITLESNLSGNFSDTSYTDPLKQNHIAAIDGWGRPIVIQEHPSNGFRLVSAGPGSGLGIENADIETTIAGNRSNDDRILYLTAATPAADTNPDCDQ